MSLSIEEKSNLVEIRSEGGAYRLYRNGHPFYVLGACGFENLERLAACGANSLRTWGSDQTLPLLGDLRRLGLTFTAGLWLEPARRGFDYRDAEAVRAQEDRILSEVERIQGEPGLLLWALGNELDLANEELAVWDAVEGLARAIKVRDPAHPVITVVASPTAETLEAIAVRCPSLDALGVNSYADLPQVRPSLRQAGWTKPYLLTEWSSNGRWDVERSPWGAPIEPSSTEKAEQIRRRCRIVAADTRQCLGSYAFFWGNKQETTPTWFNLFERDGSEYEAVEVLRGFWQDGVPGRGFGPKIERFGLEGQSKFAVLPRGTEAEAKLGFTGGSGEVMIEWRILPEMTEQRIGGDPEDPLPEAGIEILEQKRGWVRFAVPKESGAYRIYVFLTDENGRRASANIPFLSC